MWRRLDLGVRGTPEQVYSAATECLDKGAPGGGMILSFGGGISPGALPENIDALVQAAKDWKRKRMTIEQNHIADLFFDPEPSQREAARRIYRCGQGFAAGLPARSR